MGSSQACVLPMMFLWPEVCHTQIQREITGRGEQNSYVWIKSIMINLLGQKETYFSLKSEIYVCYSIYVLLARKK